ncbi:hypothetical protein VTP01DRAFT_3629 [Rhizomucor pusillus]|uniref:uncharacterized protein n=1 Tax=Rhizomucor pusillus TaxID=4840 RepID=UPI003744277C
MPKRKEIDASEEDDEYKSAPEDQQDSDDQIESSSKQRVKQERESKRTKKATTTTTSPSSTNPKERIFELSSKRRVRVGVFPNGTPFVDIRDVYNDKETGEMKWGGKGICLPLAQYEKLKELLSDVDSALEEVKKK